MPGKSDEDRYSVCMRDHDNAIAAFGLFDGYIGHVGSDVCSSEFCRRILHAFKSMICILKLTKGYTSDDELPEDAADALMCEAIYKVSKTLDLEIKKIDDSGSTSMGLFIRKLKDGSFKVYCANAGNSRCILQKSDSFLALSEDHTLKLAREFERIDGKAEIRWNSLPAEPIHIKDDMFAELSSHAAFQYPSSERMMAASEVVKLVSTPTTLNTSKITCSNRNKFSSDDGASNSADEKPKGNSLLRQSITSLVKKAYKMMSVASASFYVVEHGAGDKAKAVMQCKISTSNEDLRIYKSLERASLRDCMATGQPVTMFASQNHDIVAEVVDESSSDDVISANDVRPSVASENNPMQCVSVPMESEKLNVLIGVLVLLCPQTLHEREISLLKSMCARASVGIADALAQTSKLEASDQSSFYDAEDVPNADEEDNHDDDRSNACSEGGFSCVGSAAGARATSQGSYNFEGVKEAYDALAGLYSCDQSVMSEYSKYSAPNSQSLQFRLTRQESFITTSTKKNGSKVLTLCGRYDFATSLTRTLGCRLGPRSCTWIPEITATIIKPDEHARYVTFNIGRLPLPVVNVKYCSRLVY